jgi:hypothetical protein
MVTHHGGGRDRVVQHGRNMAKVTVTRYRWRGNTIPNRWTPQAT